MSQVIIFGTGDIARLAYFYFTHDSEHEVVAFTVDASYRQTETFLDLPLVDFEQITTFYSPDTYTLFIALSYARMNMLRAERYYQSKAHGYQLLSYVSSRCTYLSDRPPGDNCFILEDNTIQPFVTIGNNVTLWSGNHIGHDAVISDHCFIASHVVVSGHVHIGEYCFLGVNATLRHAITIAPHTLIGAGAVIMKDTTEYGVYVPKVATMITKRSDEVNL